jgi:DNA mismatch repair protein MutS
MPSSQHASLTPPVASSATPMMQQYHTIKQAHPDCLLFYRMGDFYEMFFDDALQAAAVLDIALTKRGKHNDQDIPMCGVPFHSCDSYLRKLIEHGYKVAICEQMESPEEAKKRGYKSVVERAVIRIITQGTITEDHLLDARAANYLVSLARAEHKLALAWVDISTGECATLAIEQDSLAAELARLQPKELLLADKLLQDPQLSPLLNEWKTVITPHVASFFDSTRCEQRLKSFYEVSTLDSFGDYSRAEIAACGSLIEYVALTQKGKLPYLHRPEQLRDGSFMAIDSSTRRNLELTRTLNGERKGSLLSTIDRTITCGGGRLLAQTISAPLTSSIAINERLDMVQWCAHNPELRQKLRESLQRIPDLERAISRICIGRGSPRDLVMVRQGLREAMQLADMFAHLDDDSTPSALNRYINYLSGHDSLIAELHAALKEEAPMLARDGGFVRKSYHPRLDELQSLQANSKELVMQLREKYRKETGIATLKIEQNNVIGYYIEVTPQHSSKITGDAFIHRQTMVSGVRYTTIELKQLESDIVHAKDSILMLELSIFDELVHLATDAAVEIMQTAHGIAWLDMISAYAELAIEQNYTRPVIDDGYSFTITKGRHPVVERSTGKGKFIANNCALQPEQRLWLLTGPNMAGKSTFLRQNALIALLAQSGCFVPAESAHIGIIDKLFSRVGAADDLAQGRSTFMVEMIETATILNQATPRSLVILDEIGRGTSTFDGLSIAWACLEYLHEVSGSRALFATHYHELTSLAARLPALRNYSMRVTEYNNSIAFIHEVISGCADRSYGIHVAKLAGLPDTVLIRAAEVLKMLEASEASHNLNRMIDGLPLFSLAKHSTPLAAAPTKESAAEKMLAAIEIDELSPKQALEVLYRLKEAVK